ncbi:MAG: LamG-like jellyroll fold domain-containing protein, partial [Dehalococcoidia bacterium]
HGQLSNGATLGQPGTLGNAVSFPFSGQVQVGTADWDNNHGTVALWAKANGFASGDQYFFGHTTQPAWANRIQLYTNDASGLLDLGLGNSHSRHLAIADLTANTWHHIALTWQGANGSGTYHVFVDGQDLASGSYSGLDSLQSLAHVGNDGDTGTRPFNGLMDDARVYNRALSPQEVVDLMADDTPAPNQPPAVNAGPDQSATLNGPVALALDGTVTDDGLPNPPGAVSTLWSASGPAPVIFGDASAVDTNATFDTVGVYTLTLTADDGEFSPSDSLTVSINDPLDPASDLVGHWTFDESSGSTANDSSGSANHGQLSNGAALGQPGTLGNAVSFPGSGQVQVGTVDWDNNHGTVALWAKANSFSSGDQYLFGHTTQPAWANRIQLYTNDASGMLDLGLGNSHVRHLGIADLTANTWHHIALTWEGSNGSGTYHVFVDGQDLASGQYSGLDSLHSFAHVGNDGDTGTRAFDGLIDDARVYNRALSAQEISALSAN